MFFDNVCKRIPIVICQLVYKINIDPGPSPKDQILLI